jgi:hypothetical protein
MENHLVMDSKMWNKLNLQVSVLDIDLAESDLVMLSEYQTLPYMKVNPLLMTTLFGNNPLKDDDMIPSYIYVLDSFAFDKVDVHAIEAEAEESIIKNHDLESSQGTSHKDEESMKLQSEKKKKEAPAKKLSKEEQKRLQEEEEARKLKEEQEAALAAVSNAEL